jgi:hypothetical protein
MMSVEQFGLRLAAQEAADLYAWWYSATGYYDLSSAQRVELRTRFGPYEPCSVYAVDDDCTLFLTGAAQRLPRSITFLQEHCPSSAGFARFATPIQNPHPQVLTTYTGLDLAAVAWWISRTGYLFLDAVLAWPTDPIRQEQTANAIEHAGWLVPDFPSHLPTLEAVRTLAGKYLANGRPSAFDWGDCSPDLTVDKLTVDGNLAGRPALGDMPDMLAMFRQVWTLWAVIRGEMGVEQTAVSTPRASRRRLQRSIGDIPTVTVCSLPRPPASHRGDGQGRDWSHRWIVSGHWCNHWWPKQQVHKPRWISPYVKGPEDKPLVVKERRFVVHSPGERV